MEKKIIELSAVDSNHNTCLLCCDNKAAAKLTINRVKYDDTVISFHICNKCLVRMQREIEICE